jgi:RNA polymerase sigma factor (TIGR02999 family)
MEAVPSPPADDSSPRHADALFAELYRELHRLARRELASHGAAGAGPTTLLHETYLDLAQRRGLSFPDPAHFLSYAARALRTIAIDRARALGAQKRGSEFDISSLDTQTEDSLAAAGVLPQVGQALDALAELEPTLATVVDLRFFGGFSMGEIARMQGVSERTVQRQWEKARLLLYRSLRST